MSELLRIFKDSAILGAIGAIITVVISRLLDRKFQDFAEKMKATVELEKTRALDEYQSRKAIYPEIIQVVYRLRNELRDILDRIEAKRREHDPEKPIEILSLQLGEPLYMLTERLFSWRVFLTEDDFHQVHRFKRVLQDAQVLLNRITRPSEELGRRGSRGGRMTLELLHDAERQLERINESIGELRKMYQEVDSLHIVIIQNVKNKMASPLSLRAGTAE
jgi:Mg2+ and Co2+ transporter CorA